MEKKREKTFQKWIIFSAFAESMSLAWHLQNEGKDVTYGQIWDLKTIGMKEPEDPDTHKRRWSSGKGILNKVKAEDLIERMAKIPNKDDYFVIFDFNSLYPYAEKATKMGFRYGLFPTKFDYTLENDRNLAKDFVKKFYPDLKVADVMEFKSIDDGIELIESSEEFYALKGNDICCQTVVPTTKNLEFAREELIDALRGHKEDYERQGYILECQIRDGVEFCPQCVFMDGEPVAYSVDIENKAFGSGNVSIKAGCAMNLIVAMPSDAEIIPKAFPDAIIKVAKKHKGLFYTDANIILKDGTYYFLEFCFQRMGYDAIQTECEMAGGVSNYFESLVNKESPYQSKFGVGVRGFNMHRDHDGAVMRDMKMKWEKESDPHVWTYDCHKDEKGGYSNGGYEWELLSVFTGSSDDLEYATIKAYEAVEAFSFNEMYFRSHGDFVSREYYGNIFDRYDAVERIISSPESKEEEK